MRTTAKMMKNNEKEATAITAATAEAAGVNPLHFFGFN